MICSAINCKRIGKWQPILLLFGTLNDCQSTTIVTLGIRVCTECKKTTKINDIATDELWQKLIIQINTKFIPTRTKTQLTWKKVK